MIAVYSIVRGKHELVRDSFDKLRRYAGIPYQHYVVVNEAESDLTDRLRSLKQKGHIEWLHVAGENLGQNIAANLALDELMLNAPEWVLRWDPDALPETRRFLKKLVKVANDLKQRREYAIISPKITHLKNEPPALDAREFAGHDLEIVGILGGICRLHPAEFFEGWRFNKFGALGFGEAAEVADRCTAIQLGMVRVPDVRVAHAYGEDGQAQRWPEHFGWEKEVGRYVGYGL